MNNERFEVRLWKTQIIPRQCQKDPNKSLAILLGIYPWVAVVFEWTRITVMRKKFRRMLKWTVQKPSAVQGEADWRTPFLLQQTPLATSLRSCNLRLLYTTERGTSNDTSDIESDWQMLRQSSARYAPILNKPKEKRVYEKWGRKERDDHNVICSYCKWYVLILK